MSNFERVSRGMRSLSALIVLAAAAVGVAEGQTILRVKQNTPVGDDGASWETAFDHLQDAPTAAAPIAGGGQSVEVWVAAGTYRRMKARRIRVGPGRAT